MRYNLSTWTGLKQFIVLGFDCGGAGCSGDLVFAPRNEGIDLILVVGGDERAVAAFLSAFASIGVVRGQCRSSIRPRTGGCWFGTADGLGSGKCSRRSASPSVFSWRRCLILITISHPEFGICILLGGLVVVVVGIGKQFPRMEDSLPRNLVNRIPISAAHAARAIWASF